VTCEEAKAKFAATWRASLRRDPLGRCLKQVSVSRPTDVQDAPSAFANCGHCVAYVQGRYVPILLQNDFAHLGAQDRFNIRRQCAMLIQKSMRLDSIVSNFYSTVSPRRLLQQNRH
jgi:hypothetical protein